MDAITLEKANYIIAHYSNLLTSSEQLALRHYRSIIKLENVNDKSTDMYYRIGWLSDNSEILKYLDHGYEQFIVNCFERILKEAPDDVFFNLCPVCNKLARTPDAKQCRWCAHDWH
jgi:hypothetical protein